MADNSSNIVAIVAILVIVLLIAVAVYFVFAGGVITKEGSSTVNVLPAPTKIEAPKPTTTP